MHACANPACHLAVVARIGLIVTQLSYQPWPGSTVLEKLSADVHTWILSINIVQLFPCCTERTRRACACALHRTDAYETVPAGAAAGTYSSKHFPAGIQPGRAALQPGHWAAGSSVCSSPSTGTAGLAAAAAADQPLSTPHPVPCRPGVLPEIMPVVHKWQS